MTTDTHAPPPRQNTLLLVDDEPGIRKVLGISLSDAGYTVLTADSGEAALKTFREKSPPIVLTDIKMPGMDGISLLKKIKAESPDTEVIMITGHGDMELAIKSIKYEAIDFVTKPIDPSRLFSALAKNLNSRLEISKIRTAIDHFSAIENMGNQRLFNKVLQKFIELHSEASDEI